MEGQVDWTKRINDNVDTEIINEEQQSVINQLEEVLSFLKGVKIVNDDALGNIKKPLDDLQSSLKYLPISSSFDVLPEEIKTHILSFLCYSESFKAASVCQEWKEIVHRRLSRRQVNVKVGKHCSSFQECEDNSCFMPAEIFKASMTHKFDFPLTICHPFTEVDSRVVTEGLLSVSNLTITSECGCKDDDDKCDECDDQPILSNDQLEHYFEGLDKRSNPMDKMELIGLDMTGIDQDKLNNCLLNKTKWLTLDDCEYGPMLNVETFIKKLSQITPESNLKYLIFHHFEYTDRQCDCVDCSDLSVDVKYQLSSMADALCRVENVKLDSQFPLETETLKRLIENILIRPVQIKSLIINQRVDFRKLMSPGELLTLMGRMELLVLVGRFTPDQMQAARILPEVEINGTPPKCVTLKKGRDEIFEA